MHNKTIPVFVPLVVHIIERKRKQEIKWRGVEPKWETCNPERARADLGEATCGFYENNFWITLHSNCQRQYPN